MKLSITSNLNAYNGMFYDKIKRHTCSPLPVLSFDGGKSIEIP